MIRVCIITMFAIVFVVANQSHADDLEDLCRDGYGVVLETQVDGEFDGCDYDKTIPLTNGMVFVCSSYDYSYSYRPEFLVLQHVQYGTLKYVIDDEEYDGQVYKR